MNPYEVGGFILGLSLGFVPAYFLVKRYVRII